VDVHGIDVWLRIIEEFEATGLLSRSMVGARR
jgi:hypothetical protein